MNQPCHNCQDRELGCHANCTRYLDWKAKLDEIKAARIKDIRAHYRTPRIKCRGRDMWKPFP